jgi:hypothetical protein
MKMRGTRIALGYITGAMMVLSSGAHSLLGWPSTTAKLAKTNVPADLVRGLTIGWHFGGFSILTFGAIVIWTFTNVLRNRPVSLVPALLIGIAYLATGIWALVYSGMNPFFLIFIIPGAMLIAASW